MKITYIGHSGFLIELSHTLLLFDYYRGKIPPLPKEKELFVFVSHRHQDHFNTKIFDLAKERENVFYIISADIWKADIPKQLWNKSVQLKPRERWEKGDVKVLTLKSTDEGVAFCVTAEGKKIYHAGDLNDWHWNEESDEWNLRMLGRYKKFTQPLKSQEIDVGFIPMDPRQEENYALGLEWFLQIADCKKIYPMHTWGQYELIGKWIDEHPDSPHRDKIVRIYQPGDEFEQ